MALSEDLYKEVIIQHSQSPSHRGHLSHPSVVEEGLNRSCGDQVEVELFIEAGRIQEIRVNGRGCSISTASGSVMAEAVEGMELAQASKLIDQFKSMIVEGGAVEFPEELEDLEAFKGVQRYPVRVKCATLSWNALEQALQRAAGN
ncbi:MAG: SUF system NifU family Fe-S cluster assembly protein [Leptospirales bacterium]|nr:SUF system NifU family Fe-S cluster assembly protein [Leptospirales bacterium]